MALDIFIRAILGVMVNYEKHTTVDEHNTSLAKKNDFYLIFQLVFDFNHFKVNY